MARRKIIIRHVLFWSLWIMATIGMNFIITRPTSLWISMPNYFISILLFYTVYFVVYKPFLKKSKKIFFTLPILILFFCAFHFLRISLIGFLLSTQTKGLPKVNYLNRDLIGNSLSYFIEYVIFSFGYWIAMSDLYRQKRISELELENYDLEKKQLLTEINFLKAQINPHFLYNTLNTLYAQAQPYSERLADNIMKLSEIMRYSLESVDNEKGTVALRKELEHLKNLIDIHQLRFSHTLHIDYTVKGDVDAFQVPPLCFITAVENAFKYGDLKTADHPLRIAVNITQDNIHFSCINKKKKGSIEYSHGIGINNIKKRLNIAFLDKYEMTTDNQTDFYTFELTLKN